MIRRATLTPSVIRHLTTLPQMVDQFPFLRFAKKAYHTKEKRSCCGHSRRSGKSVEQAYDVVKVSIAYLPPDRLAIIKKALNVDTLTIQVSANNKEVIHTR